MTVTLTSLATGVTRTQSDQSAKLSAALNGSASVDTSLASTQTNAATTASIESQGSLQAQGLALRLNTLQVAYVGAKVDTVDTSTQQVSSILSQLQSLASQASDGSLSAGAQIQLEGQFQALSISINNVPPSPPGSTFTAGSLLDGLPSGTANTDDDTVLGGFSSANLLGNSSIATPESAQQALTAIAAALDNIASQQQTVQGLQATVEFASASTESASQNQLAATSTLTLEDLTPTASSSQSLQASLLAQPAQAQLAQTSKLPNNILDLLAQ